MGESRKILSEMFVSEATLEFPDGEIDSVSRVLQGAARRGAIPRDAVENWPILKGFAPRPPKSDASAKPSVKPTVKSKAKEPEQKGAAPSPDARSGRTIPSTNRFRQGSASEPGESPKASKAERKPEPKSDGPSLGKRALAAIRGRDVENDIPKPKSAATKVHGGHGAASSLPALGKFFPNRSSDDGSDPLADYPDKEPVGTADFSDDERTDPEYVSPFAHIPGFSADEPDDSSDPKVSAVKKGLSKAKAATGPKPKAEKPYEPPEPPKKKQGKLSRFFKGRRDDDI